MKKVTLGLTAIALLVGLASAFASKSARTVRTIWTTAVNHSVVTIAKVNALCKGSVTLCAVQYTTLHHNPTGNVAFKPL